MDRFGRHFAVRYRYAPAALRRSQHRTPNLRQLPVAGMNIAPTGGSVVVPAAPVCPAVLVTGTFTYIINQDMLPHLDRSRLNGLTDTNRNGVTLIRFFKAFVSFAVGMYRVFFASRYQCNTNVPIRSIYISLGHLMKKIVTRFLAIMTFERLNPFPVTTAFSGTWEYSRRVKRIMCAITPA